MSCERNVDLDRAKRSTIQYYHLSRMTRFGLFLGGTHLVIEIEGFCISPDHLELNPRNLMTGIRNDPTWEQAQNLSVGRNRTLTRKSCCDFTTQTVRTKRHRVNDHATLNTHCVDSTRERYIDTFQRIS